MTTASPPISIERIFQTALAAHGAGAFAAAIAGFRRATILTPSDGRALAALGGVERSRGNNSRAIGLLIRAATLAPSDPPIQYTLANALLEAGDPESGRRGYRRALVARPGNALALGNLGQLEIECARHPDAERALSRALMIDSSSGIAASFLGEVRLARGDFRSGWPLYFSRVQAAHQEARREGMALWDGAPLGTNSLLLRGDGGLGDVLMHARFLGRPVPAAGRLILQCQDSLVDLLGRALGSVVVIGKSDPTPGADAWLPLSMLSMRLGADPDVSDHPADFLSSGFPRQFPPRETRVGLCWRGSGGTFRQRKRSMAPSAFDRLSDVANVTFLSLQVGLDRPDARPALDMVERTDRYLGAEGMTRMAREMVELDLVITVNTYVAHLAGALGVETWVLLPHGPEWRWGTGGTNSIWYPRARLFRQPRPADWDTVIRKVAAALSARSQ